MQYIKQYINHRKENDVKTMEAIAQELGVTRMHINLMQRGERSLTANMAKRMAEVTKLDAYYWINLYNIEKCGEWKK